MVQRTSGGLTGSVPMRAKSSVMARAVASNLGRCRPFNVAMDVSEAFTVTLTAATMVPALSRTGAAIERMPSDN